MTELFIVEGDSAGGSAKDGRRRDIQAILPLRGKILNVERVGDHRAFSSDTIQSLITAVGTGVTNANGEGGDFDISKARYHKIIIMTDADVDGAHIRILLMTFFYKYMRPLIDAGYVYIACPPIFGIKKGKKIHYVYPDGKTPEDQILNNTLIELGLKKPGDALRTRRTRGPPPTPRPPRRSPATPCSATRVWARWIPSSWRAPRWTPRRASCRG